MSDPGDNIAYDVVLALLSLSVVIFGIIFFIFCKNKRAKSQETDLPMKICAYQYPLTDIHTFTDGFNNRRIIGKGRLGTVYAAVLPNGELAAVKRIHPKIVLSNAGFGFSTILKSLSLAHHPNVVSILGFSEAPGERIILMEFVDMMSLDFYLHQDSDGASLIDWGQRIRVAAGAARGMEYLHEVVAPRIVHGCIKPSNILLDVNFCARICDYGLSFMAPHERGGLVGYVDNEYWVDKRGGSKECDVFGLGVVMLELLSGRRSEEGLIIEWALHLIREKRFGELLDPRLVMPSDMKSIGRLANVALACVGNCRKSRPSIIQVVAILNNLEDCAQCFSLN